MNVYGKIDEKQEESHYQDWSVPEKREGAPIPFFSIMLWSLVATAISVALSFIFGLVSPQQSGSLYRLGLASKWSNVYRLFWDGGIALLCSKLYFSRQYFACFG